MEVFIIGGVLWSYFCHFVTSTQMYTWTTRCPFNTYQYGTRCTPCSQCDQFSIVIKACSSHSDTQCYSCLGDNSKSYKCQQCPPCSKGHYVHSQCSQERPTQCRKCISGSYNPKVSYSQHCIPCTSCESQKRTLIAPCTRYSDNVCGGCKKGYYWEHGHDQCVRCRTCINAGHRVVTKCAVDGLGRDCAHSIQTADLDHKRPAFEPSHEMWNQEDDLLVEELTVLPATESLITTDILKVKVTGLDEVTDAEGKIHLGVDMELVILIVIIMFVVIIAAMFQCCAIKRHCVKQKVEKSQNDDEKRAFLEDTDEVESHKLEQCDHKNKRKSTKVLKWLVRVRLIDLLNGNKEGEMLRDKFKPSFDERIISKECGLPSPVFV